MVGGRRKWESGWFAMMAMAIAMANDVAMRRALGMSVDIGIRIKGEITIRSHVD